MSGSLWSLSAAELRDRAASAAPTPGGGAVAAVGAALGMALVQMALEVTAKKGLPGPGVEVLLERVSEQVRRLAPHADRDVEAFGRYMAAAALSKASTEQKEARKEALGEALREATAAPLAAARDAVTGLELARDAAAQCAVSIVSDAGAGAALLFGALTAVLLNVDINLPGLADLELKESAARERRELQARGAELVAETLQQVESRLAAKR